VAVAVTWAVSLVGAGDELEVVTRERSGGKRRGRYSVTIGGHDRAMINTEFENTRVSCVRHWRTDRSWVAPSGEVRGLRTRGYDCLGEQVCYKDFGARWHASTPRRLLRANMEYGGLVTSFEGTGVYSLLNLGGRTFLGTSWNLAAQYNRQRVWCG
jgi:hypothetical protein